ncbi:MAG: hypothetical protein V4659_02425 [Pseudomonadota bacterium]
MMGEDGAHVRLYLGTDEPVSLTDFVGSFVGIGNQFEKFVAADHPDLKTETEFFVKSVRSGSIEADLIMLMVTSVAIGLPGIPQVIDAIDKAQVLSKFVQDFGARVARYFVPGGRDEGASKSDLIDYLKTVRSIARDPKATARIEAAVFEDGSRDVRVAFKFSSQDAREAERQINDHRRELEARSDDQHSRVLLRFVRPSVETGKPGRKTGERGSIERIHARPLPILYASDLAEQRLRHELVSIEGNVFRRLFDVDVIVERDALGKPMAFRIVELHQVIDDGSEGRDGEPA